jgi:hypothetical protein
MSKILNRFYHKLALAGVLLCLNSAVVYGQRVELGVNLGAANYVGDVAPSMVAAETHPAFGFFGRYTISSSFAFTGSMQFTKISGSDQNFDFNKPRNISFRTNMSEYSGVLEFNFFKYGKGILDKKFTSYVFLGLGVVNYTPQGLYNNEWIDLRPLKTEGKNYKGSSTIIPFGIGIKWRLNKFFALESNFGFRKTYTDYLDDVSTTYVDNAAQEATRGVIAAHFADPSADLNNGAPQFEANHRRGNADFNDWYVIFNVSLSYRIFANQKCARFY